MFFHTLTCGKYAREKPSGMRTKHDAVGSTCSCKNAPSMMRVIMRVFNCEATTFCVFERISIWLDENGPRDETRLVENDGYGANQIKDEKTQGNNNPALLWWTIMTGATTTRITFMRVYSWTKSKLRLKTTIVAYSSLDHELFIAMLYMYICFLPSLVAIPTPSTYLATCARICLVQRPHPYVPNFTWTFM